MKTTLNKIREHSPCESGWKKLLNTLGKTKADDEELNLLTILNSNGLDDALWCLRAIEGYDFEIRAFARFCAMQNIEKIKPYTSEENYNLIINWLETGNDDLRPAAESAAWSVSVAVWSAVGSAVGSAARSVAESVRPVAESVRSVAWSARSAAWSASSRVAARADQEKELRRILGA